MILSSFLPIVTIRHQNQDWRWTTPTSIANSHYFCSTKSNNHHHSNSNNNTTTIIKIMMMIIIIAKRMRGRRKKRQLQNNRHREKKMTNRSICSFKTRQTLRFRNNFVPLGICNDPITSSSTALRVITGTNEYFRSASLSTQTVYFAPLTTEHAGMGDEENSSWPGLG